MKTTNRGFVYDFLHNSYIFDRGKSNIIDRRDEKPVKRKGRVFYPDRRSKEEMYQDRLAKFNTQTIMDELASGKRQIIKLKGGPGVKMTTPNLPSRAPEFPLRSINDRRARGLNMQLDQILESMVNGK